jgi:DNA-binding HxlR family transcriptional regulator
MNVNGQPYLRRWAPEILIELAPSVNVPEPQPRRFNELLAAIAGISDRMLTQRLRDLEDAGLLRRSVIDGPPVHVRYRLTPLGVSYARRLGDLIALDAGGRL